MAPTPLPTPAPPTATPTAPTPASAPAPAPAPAVPPTTAGPAPSSALAAAAPATAAQAVQARAAEARAAAARLRSAEQAFAERAQAQHKAAYAAALTRQGRAQATYDVTKLTYAGAKADYDATGVQADLVRELGAAATATADASRRTLATLVRATLQQSGPEAVDVLLAGDSDGNDLLARLATLETLNRLTNSLDEVEARVDADTRREKTLQDQDAALRATIEAIPLTDTRIAMEDAQQELDAAAAEVADLAASTPVTLSLTPLPDPLPAPVPAAGTDDFGGRLQGQLSGHGWAAPAVGSLTDGFGPRPDRPLPDVSDFHRGTDIGAACGAAVYAASAGVVATAAPLGTYGNWILIDHGNGITTGYAHLAEGQTVVSAGETVIAGQVIASVGSTGSSTGCHLHFEVRVDGTAIDARPFLVQRGVQFGS
ncbi:M23 family metallopeptidase [Cryobacterium cheniae]|uniref:M23 family metallopeptidase n=1 Tax=Cryobacterium cheniae TaxID=1259262 RepID=UPI001583342A|nr:M23 family metallopeptidase [Cryobacterium cheniae]